MAKILKGKEFLRWLDADPTSLDSCVAEIDEAMARTLLDRNTKNRPLRASLARLYGKDMAEGNFPTTSAALGFDTDSSIQNGQHRLFAVSASGAKLVTAVIKGLDPAAFVYEDTQQKRTLADSLAILGESHYVTLSAALSWLGKYLFQLGEIRPAALSQDEIRPGATGAAALPDLKRSPGYMTGARSLPNYRLIGLLDEHPGIRASVDRCAGSKCLLPSTILSTIHYLGCRVSKAQTEQFVDRLTTAIGIREADPAGALLTVLQRTMAGRSRLDSGVKFFYACKAIRNELNGVPTKIMKMAPDEDFPKVERIPASRRRAMFPQVTLNGDLVVG